MALYMGSWGYFTPLKSVLNQTRFDSYFTLHQVSFRKQNLLLNGMVVFYRVLKGPRGGVLQGRGVDSWGSLRIPPFGKIRGITTWDP